MKLLHAIENSKQRRILYELRDKIQKREVKKQCAIESSQKTKETKTI